MDGNKREISVSRRSLFSCKLLDHPSLIQPVYQATSSNPSIALSVNDGIGATVVDPIMKDNNQKQQKKAYKRKRMREGVILNIKTYGDLFCYSGNGSLWCQ